MRGLLLSDVREEIVSLLSESTEVHQSGDPQTAVSILMEAQFLLSDAIQNELKSIACVACGRMVRRINTDTLN
jgi:hypothetical protein